MEQSNFELLTKIKKICCNFYKSPTPHLADLTAVQIKTMLGATPYIIPAIAHEIFNFYDTAPHTNSALKLLFNACEKAAFTLPYDSFVYSMKLIEEFPDCLDGTHTDYIYSSSEQYTFEQCPVCGGKGEPYFRAFTYAIANFCYPHLPFKLWMKCEQCGNMYTWKQPQAWLDISNTYETVYPCTYNEHMGTTQADGLTDICIYGQILNEISRFTNGKSMLEVGVGRGVQLAVAMEMGFDVSAVEIDRATARRVSDLLNIPIWRGDFLKYSVARRYDVIIMGDVIEHITDPAQALNKARALLNGNGVLWLSTPNYDSAYSRMMKFGDPMWCVQNHVIYFSFKGIKKLAEECGFSVRKYNVSQRYNGSMELILTKM